MKRGATDTTTFYIEMNLGEWCEIGIEVEYSISDYDPGCCSGPPENCYPPEGGEVEIISATTEDGLPFSWTDDQDERWSTWIAENHDFDDGRYGPDSDAAYDAMRDEMMERW